MVEEHSVFVGRGTSHCSIRKNEQIALSTLPNVLYKKYCYEIFISI